MRWTWRSRRWASSSSRRTAGILRVVDPLSLQAQMETKSYQFRYVRPRQYADAADDPVRVHADGPVPRTVADRQAGGVQIDFPIIEALRKALTPGGKLDYILSQNVVIVRDTAQVHSRRSR